MNDFQILSNEQIAAAHERYGSLRVITPEQRIQGYAVLNNGFIRSHQFSVIGKTADGNYIVIEPSKDLSRRSENV